MTDQAGHSGRDRKPGAEIAFKGTGYIQLKAASPPDGAPVFPDDYRIPAAFLLGATVTDQHGRTWAETEPGLWRSTDGRYTIHRTRLPEAREALAVIFTLRWIGDIEACAWPGHIGCTTGTAGPRYSLADAQQEAAQHARAQAAAAGNDQTLQDLPSLATRMFCWPVSEGLTRAALTVTLDDGRLRARVTGMSCQTADPEPAGTWAPGTCAEIDITGLWRKVLAARLRGVLRFLRVTGWE
jgi:hypothetical protein